MALEALALEGYRTERLSESELRQMLGFETRMQVHAFLKEHGVYLNYLTSGKKESASEPARGNPETLAPLSAGGNAL